MCAIITGILIIQIRNNESRGRGEGGSERKEREREGDIERKEEVGGERCSLSR